MTTPVKVLYNEQQLARIGFCGYQEGDPLTLIYEGSWLTEYPLNTANVIAEYLFRIFNQHEDPVGFKPSLTDFPSPRSMSVGDVVVVGEIALAIGSVGWDYISISWEQIVRPDHV